MLLESFEASLDSADSCTFILPRLLVGRLVLLTSIRVCVILLVSKFSVSVTDSEVLADLADFVVSLVFSVSLEFEELILSEGFTEVLSKAPPPECIRSCGRRIYRRISTRRSS